MVENNLKALQDNVLFNDEFDNVTIAFSFYSTCFQKLHETMYFQKNLLSSCFGTEMDKQKVRNSLDSIL